MSLRAWFLSPARALALSGACGDDAVGSDGDAAVDAAVDSAFADDTAVDSDAADADDDAIDSAAVGSDVDAFVSLRGEHLPPEPRRGGDPADGFAVLAGGDYVGGGVPADLYPVAERAGIFGNEPTMPGRDSELPYYLAQFTTASGVEVVGPSTWATAPFLHNGSVPTLAALLDSRLRPRYWRRTGAWDATAVGLAFRESEVGHADLPEGRRTSVYDTTLPGYGNGGHTYGDELDDSERRALLEYLKTL